MKNEDINRKRENSRMLFRSPLDFVLRGASSIDRLLQIPVITTSTTRAVRAILGLEDLGLPTGVPPNTQEELVFWRHW
jgi:hypothetical protein